MKRTTNEGTELIILDENDSNLVVGGNKGDYEKDTNEFPRYNVGQHVELITSIHFGHIFTEGRTVANVRKLNGHWQYYLQRDKGDGWSEWEWHTADDIES